jgi:hypothetical protein
MNNHKISLFLSFPYHFLIIHSCNRYLDRTLLFLGSRFPFPLLSYNSLFKHNHSLAARIVKENGPTALVLDSYDYKSISYQWEGHPRFAVIPSSRVRLCCVSWYIITLQRAKGSRYRLLRALGRYAK